MVEEGQGGKKVEEKVDELRKEVERSGREIRELKRRVEELRKEVTRDRAGGIKGIEEVLEEASSLLDTGFDLFGMNIKKRKNANSHGLAGLVRDLGELSKESRSFRKEIDFGGRRGVIDVSVRAGPLRGSTRKPFKRRTTSIPPRVKVADRGECLVDVIDKGETLRIIVDMPGVTENDIDLEVGGDQLTISADAPNQKYDKEVKLPSPVKEKSLESTYRNGTLEIKLQKRRMEEER